MKNEKMGCRVQISHNLLLLLQLQQVGLSLRLSLSQRKVRATQSAILPNGKLFVRADQCNRKEPPRFGRVRVKRWGKSPPGAPATGHAVRIMGCKAMYTG